MVNFEGQILFISFEGSIMKKLGRYTFALLVTLAATSFIAPIINARFFINGGTATYSDEVGIDSASIHIKN